MSTKKNQGKKTAAPVAKKTGAAKTEKVEKTEKPEKKVAKTKKQAPGESVGFIYDGALKAKHGYLFCATVSDVDKMKQHTKETYSEYFGDSFSVKYVKCEDGNEALEKVLEKADEKEYRTGGGKILSASVENMAVLLKEVTGAATAPRFTFGAKPKKEASDKKKNAKKDDPDDADEGDEEVDEEDEAEDEAEGDESEGDEAEEEEEEEEKPVAKKPATKKPAASAAAKKPAAKKPGKK
jgi:hypothetical protein